MVKLSTCPTCIRPPVIAISGASPRVHAKLHPPGTKEGKFTRKVMDYKDGLVKCILDRGMISQNDSS